VVLLQIRLHALKLMEKLLRLRVQWLLVRWLLLLLLLLVVVVVAVLTIWKGILRQLWRMLQMQVLLRLLWEVLLRRRQVRRKERLLQVHIIEVEMLLQVHIIEVEILLHVHEMLLQVHIILRQRRAIRKWASCSLPCMIPSLAQILKHTLVLRLRHVRVQLHVVMLAPIRVHCRIRAHSRYVVLRHASNAGNARSAHGLTLLERRLKLLEWWLMMLSQGSLLLLQGRYLLLKGCLFL
jgi:hypothetical protein